MSETTIRTNGHARPLVDWESLPESELANFDYALPECNAGCHQGSHDQDCARYDAMYEQRFFEYRGDYYDIQQFERICRESARLRDPLAFDPFGLRVADDSPLVKWEGAQTQSAFDAIVIRYPFEWDGITIDYGYVVVGHATW